MEYSEDEMYQAVVECDSTYDRRFYYAVKTVGVYCRPSCHSRRPLQKNVMFYESQKQAEAEGYRPCKRCRPDLIEYEPMIEVAEEAKSIIDTYYCERALLGDELRRMGVSAQHLNTIFKTRFGTTVHRYVEQKRFEQAKRLLEETNEGIAGIAYEVGFESLAGFYRFFKKHAGVSPARFRESR